MRSEGYSTTHLDSAKFSLNHQPRPVRNVSGCCTSLTSRAHAQRRVIVVGRSVGRSVGLSVCVCVYLFPRFLSNRGCCRYQTWICGYVQRALGTARVWSGVVQEQHVYGGGLKLYTVIILGVR